MEVAVVSRNAASLSYLTLRKAVGILALALPFVLVIGYILLAPLGAHPAWPEPLLLGSISAYYYTAMGHVFTGTLCALALVLLGTRGYDRKDEVLGFIAGVLALGAALFPTTPDATTVTPLQDRLGWAHTIFATALFLVLAGFCFFLFTKTGGHPTARKLVRNMVYRLCGSIIVFAIVVMGFLKIFLKTFVDHTILILIFETVCLLAFGTAWLIKGEAFLKDEGTPGSGIAGVAGDAEKQGATV